MLLGTGVGDALGLPREGLYKYRARKMFGGHPLKHRFFFGRGMISDDTEHTCMVGQALLKSCGEPLLFEKSLAWYLRLWLLGLPAGIGFATLRGILRLWLGFSPDKSGVNSAGNGPAMRASLLGIYCAGQPDRLIKLIQISTRMTHRNELAEQGVLVVALGCAYAAAKNTEQVNPKDFFDLLKNHLSNSEMRNALSIVQTELSRGGTADELAGKLGFGKGVSGYILHTVPAAIFCWLKHRGNFRDAVEEVILMGGDTDTTGAITGALAGATVGAKGIPAEWIDGIWEWPRSVAWIRKLARQLTIQMEHPFNKRKECDVRLFGLGIIPRNLLFLAIVLLHGLRRLLPPY